MKIKTIKPGLLSTVQDQGRVGYRQIGVPVAGCMDPVAALASNLLLGNEENSAVLELCYGDVQFEAQTDLLIACCGGGADLYLDNQLTPYWRPLWVRKGSILHFKTSSTACFTYIATKGGWKADYVLQSFSTYLPGSFGGVSGRPLAKGDVLESKESSVKPLWAAQVAFPSWAIDSKKLSDYQSFKTGEAVSIRYIRGHEFGWFDEAAQQDFENKDFTVENRSNRMAYHLCGPILHRLKTQELLSTAVVPGTIQVNTSGNPMLLMADSQTTGGYPRIGQVAAVDIQVCAQLRPGSLIRFRPISWEQADSLLQNRIKTLSRLKISLKLIQQEGILV